jgi:putative Mg2+ transporter-C (MgtC) family protein
VAVGEFILNVGVALLLGMGIGLERQFRQHPAGLRTNALVCLGAAMFVSVSALIAPGDRTRIAAQVVSGIGFLGAGVILREGLNVRGMNTAATLWCSAAVGTLAGIGHPLEAALGSAAIVLVNFSLRPIVRWIDARTRTAVAVETCYRFRVVCHPEHTAVVRAVLMRHIGSQAGMSVHGLSVQEAEGNEKAVIADVYSTERNDRFANDLVSRLGLEPSVSTVSWERV